MKSKKNKLQSYIKETVQTMLSDMGDSKMEPDMHMFYYRGEAPEDIKMAVKGIVDIMEDGGITLPMDKDALISKIIMDIHKVIKGNE